MLLNGLGDLNCGIHFVCRDGREMLVVVVVVANDLKSLNESEDGLF